MGTLRRLAMQPLVTGAAKRHTVLNGETEFRMTRPRLDVVRVQPATARAAILTGVAIAPVDGVAPGAVPPTIAPSIVSLALGFIGAGVAAILPPLRAGGQQGLRPAATLADEAHQLAPGGGEARARAETAIPSSDSAGTWRPDSATPRTRDGDSTRLTARLACFRAIRPMTARDPRGRGQEGRTTSRTHAVLAATIGRIATGVATVLLRTFRTNCLATDLARAGRLRGILVGHGRSAPSMSRSGRLQPCRSILVSPIIPTNFTLRAALR
jgi:hypothetical protein